MTGAASAETIAAFRALHVPGDPLVLVNIWDAGSARAVAAAGAKAIATGSYGVAESQGFKDGETFALADAIANLERILRVTELPVSIDLEAGYGATPAEVGTSVAAARAAGASGINMEDRLSGTSAPLPAKEAAARIAAAAASGLFVNARCDVFRGRDVAADGPALANEVIERARRYADAGAAGLFVPFLSDAATISVICERSPLPVNILWSPPCGDRDALAALGVARISHGHQPWAAAMDWLREQAKAVLGGAVPPYAAGA